MTKKHSTKDKLAWTASKLFQEKGYEGVGLSEILTNAKLPKGSLYHHFQKGKSDLAMTAASYASREMMRIIDDAFVPAKTYDDGMTTLFFKCAKLFDLMGKWNGCPVSGILLSGPRNPSFQDLSNSIFDTWITRIAEHAQKLGVDETEAQDRATHLFITLQGGWTLARAQQSSDVLRQIPSYLKRATR
ncbi:TetR/AcrR family transcriptional regulator [uncultured Litoreibacter sp.]|uniref:TetR/AcrR family transcriptional regulator n=1 Tax=uncultured Litoreibacter sp. TaxID=1392394 RepID=UPI0026162E2B|nr:TetR/AcrR family transcriptional regulator [uncultured Litoreibacter sp.]